MATYTFLRINTEITTLGGLTIPSGTLANINLQQSNFDLPNLKIIEGLIFYAGETQWENNYSPIQIINNTVDKNQITNVKFDITQQQADAWDTALAYELGKNQLAEDLGKPSSDIEIIQITV